MLASTLLVTIRGPFKTMDMELPGDVLVSELIPLLLEICGSQENDPQELLQVPVNLQVAGMSAPLSPESTLIDADVYDGTVLVLQTHSSPSIHAESLVPQGPKSVRPGVNSGGIGVTWETLV